MKHRGQDYYECAIVLYNDDEKPGYLAANLSGSEEEVFKKAKKLWKDFIPYPLISSTPKEDKYPVTLSPNYVTTFFDWFYAPDLKRWFISGQHIPYPKSKIEKSKDFKISHKISSFPFVAWAFLFLLQQPLPSLLPSSPLVLYY